MGRNGSSNCCTLQVENKPILVLACIHTSGSILDRPIKLKIWSEIETCSFSTYEVVLGDKDLPHV